MGSVNKVILIGNLGADPELQFTSGNTPVARFSVATTEVWKDKAGQQQERTEWHRIVVWGKLSENIKYLTKGRQVYVEGKLRSRQWEGRDGQKKYTTEVVASSVVFLGGPRGERTEDSFQQRQPQQKQTQHDEPMECDEPEAPPPESDIPF